MKKINLLLFICIFWHFSFAQKLLSKEFIINGVVENFTGKSIVINYLDFKGNVITDSSKVINSRFSFRGNINEPTLARLTGAIKSPSVTDVNYTELFLEPNELEIEIEESHFKSLKVIGSNTQDDLEILKKTQKPINDKLEILNSSFSKIRNAYIKLNKPDSLLLKINNLRQEINSLYNQLNPTQISFIKEFTHSYISAYLIFQNLRDRPIDSSYTYYAGLSPQVQSSFYGKLINQYIVSNKNSAIGLTAPLFKVKDIKKVEVNLINFKNKNYVLLDFWASWCIPCRQSTPALIRTYNLYKEKGLEIISISIDDNEKAWKAAVLKDKIPWLNIITGSKPNTQSLRTLFNVTPVPTYILIEKDGIIVGRYEGADDKLNTELLNDLEKVFTKK